jgi:hypothetical protein
MAFDYVNFCRRLENKQNRKKSVFSLDTDLDNMV